MTVTGVPARRGPVGCEPVTGDVSGDNAALEHVKEVAGRFAPVDTAILFLGGARMAFAFEGVLLTLDGWAQFKEGRHEIETAFTEAGLADRRDFAR